MRIGDFEISEPVPEMKNTRAIAMLRPADEIVLEKNGDSITVNTGVVAVGSPTNPTVVVSGLPTGVAASSVTSPILIDANTKLGTGTITFSANINADTGTSTVTVTPVCFRLRIGSRYADRGAQAD